MDATASVLESSSKVFVGSPYERKNEFRVDWKGESKRESKEEGEDATSGAVGPSYDVNDLIFCHSSMATRYFKQALRKKMHLKIGLILLPFLFLFLFVISSSLFFIS